MVSIRGASLSDLEGLREVWRNDGQRHTRDLMSYPVSEWIIARRDYFFVADTGIKPVGFIVARNTSDGSKIDFLSVKKTFQGKGIEKLLLDALEEQLSLGKVYSYVPKDNEKLVDVFKKQGYSVYNEIANLFGPSRNALVFMRDLSAPAKQKKAKKGRQKPEPRESEGARVLGKSVYKNTRWNENMQQLEHTSDDEMADELSKD
jgi:ribosomal protein S18 acetylase RimI-like enzyme